MCILGSTYAERLSRMSIMMVSNASLTNLPDELLLIILGKLSNIDILYSLFGLNTRLNQIVRDPCFTTEINLVDLVNGTSRQMEIILDRFCLEILSKIDHLIRRLKVQPIMMERILLSADYPNLSQLDIFIPQLKPVIDINDESSLVDRFKDRPLIISVTSEEIDCGEDFQLTMRIRANLFNHIFKIFPHLQQLTFYENLLNSTKCVYFPHRPSIFSSSLVKLNVNVYSFQDFLHLIDGRFDQLRILIVKVLHFWLIKPTRMDARPITNLKEFSFTSWNGTDAYDEYLVPTLQRMIHLEKLFLHTNIYFQPRFTDGNHLKEDILHHMPLLKDFMFDIRSIISLHGGEVHLQSDEEIRSTLTDLTKHQVTTCVDYFYNKREGHCHIYTNPLLSIEYEFISNNFRGELFEHVQYVELYDERPFEHSFFMRIAQSFPSMKRLCVENRTAQQEKQDHQSSNENQNSTKINYGSLQRLVLRWVHDDYLEQFLFDTKTFFSNGLTLTCEETQLKRVTHNFTREVTKVNCSKVKSFKLHVERDILHLI